MIRKHSRSVQSLELVLIEVINGIVNVQQAKLSPGQAPQKGPIGGSGFLLNPRGSFIGGSTLEATFSIDETLLDACKEWSVGAID